MYHAPTQRRVKRKAERERGRVFERERELPLCFSSPGHTNLSPRTRGPLRSSSSLRVGQKRKEKSASSNGTPRSHSRVRVARSLSSTFHSKAPIIILRAGIKHSRLSKVCTDRSFSREREREREREKQRERDFFSSFFSFFQAHMNETRTQGGGFFRFNSHSFEGESAGALVLVGVFRADSRVVVAPKKTKKT